MDSTILSFPTDIPSLPDIVKVSEVLPSLHWLYCIVIAMSMWMIMKIPIANLKSYKPIPCLLFIALVTNVIFCNIVIILQLHDFTVSVTMINLEIFFEIMLNLTDLSTITCLF
jgi:hypothetical protein